MTTDSSDITKNPLHDFVEEQTSPLDLVASWETLCDVYRALEFSDPLSDTVRLEEFKWIIKEMNKFLTRMRNKLLSCRNVETTQEVLKESFTPAGQVSVDSRRQLAFQKLRQRWISMILMSIQDQLDQGLEEEEDNGWPDRYDD